MNNLRGLVHLVNCHLILFMVPYGHKLGELMKSILVIVLALFSHTVFSATSFTSSLEVQKMYEKSSLPDFGPWIGVAVPGRCFFKSPKEVKTASVLIPSQFEEGLAIAPLSADKRAANFFDKMSYAEITTRFSQVKDLYRFVHFNDAEAILYKTEGKNEFEARIREFEDYFFVKVILKDHTVRYCYYVKA